ncbi:MAG: MFS transporter, partial [Candidatus Altiarchaeota archaeon]
MGNLKNLFYSSFFSGLVVGALGVILPVYLSESFKITLTTMGFIFSSYALLFVLIQIPSSYLGDRFNRRNIMILSALLDAVAVFVYGIASKLTHFLIGKGVEGISTSLSRSTSDTLLIDLSEKHRFSESFGNLIGYFSVGYVFGYFTAGPLVSMLG